MQHSRFVKKKKTDTLDSWLMTYADMITLLLCFFAILLAISIPKKERFEEARVKVMEKFANASGNFASERFIGSAMLQGKDSIREKELGKIPLQGLQSIIKMYQIHNDVTIRQTDRRTVIAMRSEHFFTGESAELSEEGQWLLREIAKTFKKRVLQDYQVFIESHTDGTPPVSGHFPTNWELSTARATAVLRFFLAHGVPAGKLRASGYADTYPEFPNEDGDGNPIEENQAKNRRIVIKLEAADNEA